MRGLSFTVMGILLLGLSSLAQQAPRIIIPDFALEDQFGGLHDLKAHRGSVLVLIYGDRASANANKALGEQLHVLFHPSAKGQPPALARRAPVRPLEGATGGASPDVLALPVACIGKVPQLVRTMIRTQFRNASPDVPVWLDFNDVMKANFPFRPGVPNVVVLDTQGRYRYAAAGVPSAEGMARLEQAIEGLRREALRPADR